MCHDRSMSLASSASSPRLRVRRSAAITVAAFIGWLAVSPLALGLIIERPFAAWAAVPLGAALLAAPLGISFWAWRSGVDVTREGITVRGLVSARRIAWRRIDGFAADDEGVAAILDDQSQVRLIPLRAENLPQVLEIGGQELREGPAPEDERA